MYSFHPTTAIDLGGKNAKDIRFATLVAIVCCRGKRKQALLGAQGLLFLQMDSGGCLGKNIMLSVL